MRVLFVLFAALQLAAACSSSVPVRRSDPTDRPVESWDPLEVGPLNSAIEQALAEGAAWPLSAGSVVLELLGGDGGARSSRLMVEHNRPENPDSAIVVLARDGFLDDSVRGDWHRFVLRRSADRTWRVAEARRAMSCWRADTTGYRAGLCL